MIKGKKILAVITARGNSKGLPHKNIRELAGKPLIAWSIEAARKSKYIDRLVLSSDSSKIMKIAKEFGCEVPFTRPSELALDETPGVDPVLHAIENLPGFDFVVLLQPTSPFRCASDIDGCLELSLEANSKACISIVEASETPYWMYRLDKAKKLGPLMKEKFARRQDLPPVYVVNGAVYVAEIKWLKKNKDFISDETVGFVMPRERSLDIDTEEDFELAERKLAHL